MAKQSVNSAGDITPITGGIPLSDRLIATPQSAGDAPDDDLGRQIFWLLSLHRDKLPLRFREVNAAALDDHSKLQIIADIQHELGIEPLNNGIPF